MQNLITLKQTSPPLEMSIRAQCVQTARRQDDSFKFY